MATGSTRIMFSVGDVSADEHAARVIKRLRRDGDVECFGMGGRAMQEAGMQRSADLTQIGAFGIVGIARHAFKIFSCYREMVALLKKRRPDLLITVDYSGFNLRLAGVAQRLGVKVLVYIAPQVWASRRGRVKRLARVANSVAFILPFENDIYQSLPINAEYVGHPLVEKMAGLTPEPKKEPETQQILLLPGSRQGEIQQLMPVLCGAMDRITQQVSTPVSFRLLLASSVDEDTVNALLGSTQQACTIVRCQDDAQKYQEMARADIAISASGTATLELAMLGVPHIVIYKVSPLNALFMKSLLYIKVFSLPNILSKRLITPELMQEDATPDKVANAVVAWLSDAQKLAAVRKDLAQVPTLLGQDKASENVVRMAHALLKRV